MGRLVIDRPTWLLLGARLAEIRETQEALETEIEFDIFDQATIRRKP